MKWTWGACAVLLVGCGSARGPVPAPLPHGAAAQARPVSAVPAVGGAPPLAPAAHGPGADEVVAHRHPLPKPEVPVIRPFNPPLPGDASLKFAPPPPDPSRLPPPVPPLPTAPVEVPAFDPPEPVLLPDLPPPVSAPGG